MSQHSTQSIHPGLSAQRKYTSQLALQGAEFALVAAEAFVRGIRDIGYKSTATALDELIDNSIQAGATRVDVAFEYARKSSTKPTGLALIDDGHGMDPEMIRASAMWGGTHRENDRSGFGRYGYGLPSACVSQGTRFTVYSRPEAADMHRVELDIEKLGAGEYHADNGRVEVPQPIQSDLPSWVRSYALECDFASALDTGTVVVIDQLDRLSWVTKASLERNLLQHFGITYRNFLGNVEIRVNGKRVEPIDPLFVTEGFRFYDIDEDRAKPLEDLKFSVKDRITRAHLGDVRVRFSWLPPTFARIDKSKNATRSNSNGRFGVMREHLGIIFLRAGRQIDVITKNTRTVFQNNDRYWNVEVNFPPALDEEFSITTSKQQIVLSDRMWDLLEEHGVFRAIDEMRRDWQSANRAARTEREAQRKDSEQVMEDSSKFSDPIPVVVTAEREAEAQRNLRDEAKRRAEEKKQSVGHAIAELEAEIDGHPYKVRQEDVPGGAFYRPQQLGGQFVVWVNKAHRFFTDVYAGKDSTPDLRNALDLVLFSLGEAELKAVDDKRRFYQSERQMSWSPRLTTLLELLESRVGRQDLEALEEEIDDVASAANEVAKVDA
jgi:hypothetical protein